MPHIKVVFLWPYARVRGVHPAYARAYAYAYHLCICIPPTQGVVARGGFTIVAKVSKTARKRRQSVVRARESESDGVGSDLRMR